MTDHIDHLVDWQLDTKPKHSVLQQLRTTTDTCPKCRLGWHGLPKAGCAGSYQEGERVPD